MGEHTALYALPAKPQGGTIPAAHSEGGKMKKTVIALVLTALSACSPWGQSETGRAVVAGEEYRVFYLTTAPGTYVMRVTKFKWVAGLASEEKAFAIEATGQVARQLCGGNADLVSVDYSPSAIPYDVTWKCRR